MQWGPCVYRDFSKDPDPVFSLVGTWGDGEALKVNAQVITVGGQ